MRERRSYLSWSSTDQTSVERIHWLRQPLEQVRLGRDLWHGMSQSLDRSVIESFTVSSGANEFVGVARYDQDAQSLVDLIKAGSENKTITYVPNAEDPDRNYACLLVSPRGEHVLGLDPSRGQAFGEQTVELRLRPTDESPVQPLEHGANALLWFRAGDSLQQGTFTRADTATRTMRSSDGGYGTLSTVPSGQSRIEWLSSQSSVGPRTFPSLLLEASRTNRIANSEDLSTWSQNGTPTLTSGQTDPYGGSNAWLIADTATGAVEFVFQVTTLTSTDPAVISGHFKQGTTVSTGARFQLFDNTTNAPLVNIEMAFSSGIPSLNFVQGTSIANPERLGRGFWRIQGRTSGGITTGNVYHTRIIPTGVNSSEQADLYAFGIQVEQ